jgi:DNA-binding NtrC family response regulator
LLITFAFIYTDFTTQLKLIIATHKDLAQEVKKGRFREDLYYRLLGLSIQVPPLKDRESDIILLAKYFMDKFCKENNFPKKSFSQAAQTKLLHYAFPGNVRELKAIIELACVMTNTDVIEEGHIEFRSSILLMKHSVRKLRSKRIQERSFNCT